VDVGVLMATVVSLVAWVLVALTVYALVVP